MLDALRQVVHLRAYAQKKPIDEYKREAFLMFERMLATIREDVTSTLARARFARPEDLPPMPAFITQHIDPFTGEDDTADIDADTGAILSRLPVNLAPVTGELPAAVTMLDDVPPPASRNAPCPCGSGRKYQHCHGAVA